MSDDKPQPPADRSPQGGSKDTNDLSDIKDVQKKGMQEKGQQINHTPEDVVGTNKGTDKPIRPQNR